MSHSFNPSCDCKRCVKEKARRTAQSQNDPRRMASAFKKLKTRKTPREKIASREEQHARYIDCGPAAWDDR